MGAKEERRIVCAIGLICRCEYIADLDSECDWYGSDANAICETALAICTEWPEMITMTHETKDQLIQTVWYKFRRGDDAIRLFCSERVLLPI